MGKGQLLLFTFCIVVLGCSEPSGEGSANRLNDAAAVAQARIASLTDSIRGLQTELAMAQKNQKTNDSLVSLVNELINDRQKQGANAARAVEPPSAATDIETNYRSKMELLTREKDSIYAAYQKTDAELKKINREASKNSAVARQSDSLRVANANLSAALSQSRQQLTMVARQKKRDSLTLVSSSTSTAQQQRELSRLMTQRDSLAKANQLLSSNTQNYQRDIERLRQQKKNDSLRYVLSSKAAGTSEDNAKAVRQRDSLATISRRLSSELTSEKSTVRVLRERRHEDSVRLAALESPQAETPAEAAAPQPSEAVTEDTETPAQESAGPATLPSDSSVSIRRWADASFNEKQARDLREGFRLLLLAQQEEKRDPTLSLKLLREAGRYSDDSIIRAETKRVYDNNYFYEVLVQKKRRIRSISLNDKYLAANLSNDSAYLYQGVDSVLTQVKALSKVSVALLPPQPYLFTGSPSGQVVVHNLTSGKQQASFQAHDERVTAFGFTGKTEVFLATGSADKTIYLWSNKYERGDRLVGLKSAVTHLSVSRGLLIAGASGDFAPRLWNTDGKLLLNLTGHKDSVYSLDVSTNAKYLLTTSRDKTASLWDLKGTFIRSYGGHRAALTHGKISNGQRYVALASEDGTVALWGINGGLISKLTGHTQQVNQVAFDKSDTYLYTCSDDGTVRRWLIKKPKEIDLTTIPPFTEKEKRENKIK